MIIINYLIIVLLTVLHPLKMTTSNIKVDEKTGKIEVTTNFFLDDFKTHLTALYRLDITPLGTSEKQVIEDYVRKNLIISFIADHSIDLTIANTELIDENILQVKLTGNVVPSTTKSIKITNTLLLDAFPNEQENIVYLNTTTWNKPKVLHFSIQESIQLIEMTP